MLGVFAPAVAALTLTGMCEGEDAVRQLVRRLGQWRVRPQWYAVAIGLPVAQALIGIALALSLHKFKSSNLDSLGAILPSMWIFFLFATGEELGWRGFALPRLVERYGPFYASLTLGALQSLWHWPLLLLPHGLMSGIPLLPWTVALLAEALVFTWLFQSTNGSVLIVVLWHGMVNSSMLLFHAIDSTYMPWIKSGICLVTTVAVVIVAGSELGRKKGKSLTASAG